MKREDLLAPENYNIVDEIERYASNEGKLALMVHHENGEIEKITYKELVKKANKVANVLTTRGLKKAT